MDDQQKTAILRQRYLEFLKKSIDKSAEIEMCEKTRVSAKIRAFQPNSEHVIVENLATPIGIVDHAVLRATDIVKINVDLRK